MRLALSGLRFFLCAVWVASLVSCELEEAALDGHAYVLESAEGFRPLSGTTVQLAFQDEQLGLRAGCNNIFGSFELQDSRLITGELGGTELGCDAALAAQDEWLKSFLSAKPTVSLSSDHMTLHSSIATLVFVSIEVANPDRELVGTVWSVDTFLEDDAASDFFLQPGPTVEFAADQSLQLDTTCNTATGRYVLNNDSLTVSNVKFTTNSCSGAARSADAHLRELFRAGTLSVEITGSRLTLGSATLGISAIAGDAGDAGEAEGP